MHPIEKKTGNIIPFLRRVFASLKKDNIDVSQYELDHICYRVNSIDKYEIFKQKLSKYGLLLTEAIINGRAISTYKLNEPIIFENRKIWCIELPSPKKGTPYQEGYEHVEFVIDLKFDKFMALYPKIKFDTREITKSINPDVTMNYEGFSIKFHHNTLEYVIKYLQ